MNAFSERPYRSRSAASYTNFALAESVAGTASAADTVPVSLNVFGLNVAADRDNNPNDIGMISFTEVRWFFGFVLRFGQRFSVNGAQYLFSM